MKKARSGVWRGQQQQAARIKEPKVGAERFSVGTHHADLKNMTTRLEKHARTSSGCCEHACAVTSTGQWQAGPSLRRAPALTKRRGRWARPLKVEAVQVQEPQSQRALHVAFNVDSCTHSAHLRHRGQILRTAQ